MKKRTAYIGLFKAIVLALSLTSTASFAAFINVDVKVSDYIELNESLSFTTFERTRLDTTYTPITPIDLSLSYEIDFSRSAFEGFPTEFDHKGQLTTFEENGRRIQVFNANFFMALRNYDSPFEDELKAGFPVQDPITASISRGLPSLRFFSRVVTDLATGEILHDESDEYFLLREFYGFRNDVGGLRYGYETVVGLFTDKVFAQGEVPDYSVADLQDMLARDDLRVRYNELAIESLILPDEELSFEFGYVGDGTSSFIVSEPAQAALILLFCAYIARRRASH